MIRLLIVTNQPQFGENIGLILSSAPQLEVTSIASFERAVEHLSAQTTDVLLVDYDLGVYTGWDLIERLCVVSPGTRGLIMRDAPGLGRDIQNVSVENADTIFLPFSRSKLIAEVERVYQNKVSIYHLSEFSLLEVLQLSHQMKQSVLLSLHGQVPGIIRLEEGEVVHAETNELIGERALEALLLAPPCWVRTTQREEEGQSTIERPFQTLLFRVMPINDAFSEDEDDEYVLFFDDDEGLDLPTLDPHALTDFVHKGDENSLSEQSAVEHSTPWERLETVSRDQSLQNLLKLRVDVDERENVGFAGSSAPASMSSLDRVKTSPLLAFKAVDLVSPEPVVSTQPTLKKWLRGVVASIPKCTLGACVDLSSQALFAHQGDGHELSDKPEILSTFVADMFEASAAASAEPMLSVNEARPPKEIIVFSDDLLFILLRSARAPHLGLLYACEDGGRLGISLNKARASVVTFEEMFADDLTRALPVIPQRPLSIADASPVRDDVPRWLSGHAGAEM